VQAGVFTRANDATIKGRQIIKAKRRNIGEEVSILYFKFIDVHS